VKNRAFLLPILASITSIGLSQSGAVTTVNVSDPSGAGIQGAEVRVVSTSRSGQNERLLQTDVRGSVSLKLSPGTYELSVKKDGFRTVNQQLVITHQHSDETYKVVMPLVSFHATEVSGFEDYGTVGFPLRGFVVLAGTLLNPVSGVTIKVFDQKGIPVASVVTDSNGEFSFPNLKPGDYSLGGTFPATRETKGYFRIDNNSTSLLSLVLGLK
jgi:hypothetical protein